MNRGMPTYRVVLSVMILALMFLPVAPTMAAQGNPAAAKNAASNPIDSKQVPTVVAQIFSEVFGQPITAPESTYWKIRARSDKRSEGALRGAMLYQKSKGASFPSANRLIEPAVLAARAPSIKNVVCQRSQPYPLARELQQGMTVVKNGLLKQAAWKNALPLSSIQNCLRIKFANNEAELQTIAGSMGMFLGDQSSLNDLRIVINPAFANDGHVVLGEVLAHEITHAWQFTQTTLAASGVPQFTAYVAPDCFQSEAEAFWTEISYIRYLSESDKNDLQEALQNVLDSDDTATQGAFDALELVLFASRHQKSLQTNPIEFLRLNFVLPNPFYTNQCLY